METGLAGKVVFITGASGGIGRGMAKAFADEDARLVLQGHRQFDALREFVRDGGLEERSLLIDADVTNPDELDRAFAHAASEFGRVDVCIANAGVWPPEDVPLWNMDTDRVREVVDVDLLGAVWTARAFLRSLARTGPRDDGHGASLVFTGSTAGQFGERGHCDYALSKAGLVGLVRSLKNEIVDIDPRGRVNMVQPGWTVTSMARPALEDPENVRRAVRTMPLRQLARAEDIAATAVFLASPTAARHVSGEVLTVAGGMEGRQLWTRDQIDPESIADEARG